MMGGGVGEETGKEYQFGSRLLTVKDGGEREKHIHSLPHTAGSNVNETS